MVGRRPRRTTGRSGTGRSGIQRTVLISQTDGRPSTYPQACKLAIQLAYMPIANLARQLYHRYTTVYDLASQMYKCLHMKLIFCRTFRRRRPKRGAYSEPHWKLICSDIAAGIARVNDATVDRSLGNPTTQCLIDMTRPGRSNGTRDWANSMDVTSEQCRRPAHDCCVFYLYKSTDDVTCVFWSSVRLCLRLILLEKNVIDLYQCCFIQV